MNRSILVSGTEWRYYSFGNGTHPLLIFPGSLGVTEGIASFLSEHLGGCRVIVPEYVAAENVQECLDGVDSILAREQVDRFAVFGGSFGGLIAQAVALRFATRITHLILSGTSIPDPARIPANARALKILRWIPVSVIRAILRIVLRKMVRGAKNPIWASEYSHLISRLSKLDIASRYKVALDFDRYYRFDPAALPASIKILILEGAKDRIANRLTRDRLRQAYPGAQYHIFRNAGHSAMVTHTDEWRDVVKSFLVS